MQSVDLASETRVSCVPSGCSDEAGNERTVDMATMILTDRTLGDVVFALRTALGRVREDELGSPTVQTQWRCVQQWLTEAEAFRRGDASGSDFVRLKAFPVSGTELRALQVAVDQAEQRRTVQQASLAAVHARHRPIPEAPHRSIERVRITSLVLAAALVLSLLVNVTWLALLHLGLIVVPHLSLVLAINSLVSFITLCVWATHHWQLWKHVSSVLWHGPPVPHPAEPLHQPIP
jgi:hypothetical protein